MIQLVSGCKYLEIINLSECTNLSDASMVAISTNCKQLKTIEVALCVSLTDTAIISLAKVVFLIFYS